MAKPILPTVPDDLSLDQLRVEFDRLSVDHDLSVPSDRYTDKDLAETYLAPLFIPEKGVTTFPLPGEWPKATQQEVDEHRTGDRERVRMNGVRALRWLHLKRWADSLALQELKQEFATLTDKPLSAWEQRTWNEQQYRKALVNEVADAYVWHTPPPPTEPIKRKRGRPRKIVTPQ